MKTIIIAEAGVNHNGDIELAKQLISAAKSSGADFVKFQSFKACNVATQFAEKADYQKEKNGF
jgi:N,N'-diacetyllegionaminate synthase